MSNDPIAAPLVFKFGGSSFVELDAYHRIADYVAARLRESGRQAVVVVSAMSGTTGKLLEALLAVNEAPPSAALSMALPSGETTSAGLLIAALDSAGIAADGLQGNQIGLTSDGPADRGTLREVKADALREMLSRVTVVVLPGGQGADASGAVTMLGRNSSDLSAIALAGELGSGECELFSDVPGVCSADPYLVPTARVLTEVDYRTMCLLSEAGAKVIHGQAVRWAADNNVKIICRSLPPAAASVTTIAAGGPRAAVTLHDRGDVWTFRSPRARQTAIDALADAGLESLAIDVGGTHLVVNTFGLAETAAACCADGTLSKQLVLLTVLHADGAVSRLLVPRAEAGAQLLHQHDLLYPTKDLGPEETLGLPAKQRSELSGVLLGDEANR